MPFFLHIFFNMVAQMPSSLATSLIGKWKYLVSCSKVIVVVAERSVLAIVLVAKRNRKKRYKREGCSVWAMKGKG